jgi:hypothetical protein
MPRPGPATSAGPTQDSRGIKPLLHTEKELAQPPQPRLPKGGPDLEGDTPSLCISFSRSVR